MRVSCCVPLLLVSVLAVRVFSQEGVPDGPCLDTGFRCINDCATKEDGEYQWCGGCRIYVVCLAKVTFYQHCPSNTVWNDLFGRCLGASTVCHECLVYKPSTSPNPNITTPAPPDRDCLTTGSICIESCETTVAGIYQWCGSCTKFIQCVGGVSYITECFPPGLVYDHSLGRCDYESTTCSCSPVTEPPNPCQGVPCANGGTCVPGTGNEFTCNCRPGYTGERCLTNIDECNSTPCINGGTCLDGENEYVCYCPPGYTGSDCETRIDRCEEGPCQHGGTCNNIEDRYECVCAPGYTGTHCEINIDECESNPCENGECADRENGFICFCRPGFTGSLCQTDIDECESNPCENGECEDRENGYICLCRPGFTGSLCQSEISECSSNPCRQGSTCTNLPGGGWRCFCAPGWTGVDCNSEIEGCSSSPCRYGSTCVPQPGGGWSCICSPGWTGNICYSNIDECSSGPCMGNSTCRDLDNGYVCECAPGFTGPDCRTPLHPCDRNPCTNGGTCVPVGVSFTCRCPDGFSGQLCEIRIPTDFIPGCGEILNKAPDEILSMPSGWHTMCYLLNNQTAHHTTACEFLLRGLPHFNDAAGLTLAGGLYGCWIGRSYPDPDMYNSCHRDYQHNLRLNSCLSCQIMTICIRYPFDPPAKTRIAAAKP